MQTATIILDGIEQKNTHLLQSIQLWQSFKSGDTVGLIHEPSTYPALHFDRMEGDRVYLTTFNEDRAVAHFNKLEDGQEMSSRDLVAQWLGEHLQNGGMMATAIIYASDKMAEYNGQLY